MNMKSMLLKQYELYPKMQIQDMVKLIYQNEFGGGHLIANEKISLQKLQEECSALKGRPRNKIIHDAFEEIGNGLCRFHLKAAQSAEVDLRTVNRFFVNTANSICGSVAGFEEKLDILRRCCEDGDLPYSLEELEEYLLVYQSQGYRPVNHTDKYRESYFPAYRLVKTEYRDFFEVFRRLDALFKSKDTLNVAIDGNSGAGKSTLALLINSVYEGNIFHMDDFFLTPEQKTPERLNEVGGNVDYVRFKQEVITGLHSGRQFQYRTYDCTKTSFGQLKAVTPKKLNIIEGSYSMHPTLISNYDLKIFLQIGEKEQSLRILKRNGALMHKRFINEWIPMENRYFKEMRIQEQSDLVYRDMR